MRAIIFTLVFLAASSNTALAGSFCVVGEGIPPQCLYDDVASCKKASAPPNTFCGVDPAARLYYYGSQRYCAVHSSRIAECVFNDMAQCYDATFRDPDICFDRETSPKDVNPFRYDPRIGK